MSRIYLLLAVLLACSNISFAQQDIEANINNIDHYLIESVANGFTGAFLIAKDGKKILNKGYGKANKEEGLDNTSKTVFDIGSVTKQFTATAILKLVEQNKLKVTDPIHTFFSNLPDDKKNINVHQLLTHSAGLIQGVGDSDFDHIPVDEYFEEVFNSTLLFQPGTSYSYSNAGYSILARIIELLSGQEYEAFLNEYLFEPAGMYQSGYLIPNWNTSLFSNGYRSNVVDIGSMASRYKEDGKISWVLKGNGGINSTMEDMFKWYLALKSNTILTKELTEVLTTPYVLEYEGESSYYAYGWVIFESSNKTKMIAHDGSNGTFFYDFRWLPEEDVLILYACNALTREIGGMAWRIEKMLFDSQYIPRAVAVDLSTLLIEFTTAYTGSLDELALQLQNEFGEAYKNESNLNSIGYYHLQNGNIDMAIALFEINTDLFPNEANVWDSIGEAYYENGEKKKALNSYKKVLEIDPNNGYVKEKVEEMEKE